jgi:formylmethanofuran dehydrogenase subunit E
MTAFSPLCTDMTHQPPVRSFADTVSFHGHACPGLAIGYRAAVHALETLRAGRDEDEELVAIVENDACGIDAIQVVTGCTIGKGNLIMQDLGKHAYTFVSRKDNKAIRIIQKPGNIIERLDPDLMQLRQKVFSGTASPGEQKDFHARGDRIVETILGMPHADLFDTQEVAPKVPEKARIFRSVPCSACGEMVAEHRARVKNGRVVCLACSDEYSRGW